MSSKVMRSLCAAAVVVSATVQAQSCDQRIDRQNLIACLLSHAPTLRIEAADVRASEGRLETARPFLPSNPTVTGTLASRTTTTQRATNWTLTLAQELELAGQSVLRTQTATFELEAHRARFEVARAERSEEAWLSYFAVLALRERVTLAQRVERATVAVAVTTRAMSTQGLSSSVEATVAEAASIDATRARLAAVRELAAREVGLGTLLGVSATIEGTLEPLAVDGAVAVRPERRAVTALREASTQRVATLRRARLPNLTLSVFAQNDGFDEKVFGGGVGLPIPLPQPIGRTRAGEISEALANEERSEAELARLLLVLEGERVTARAGLEASTQTRALYSPERIEQALQALDDIAREVTNARLAVKDALVLQRALIDFVRAAVDSEEALCAASVRWVRANGGVL